MKIPAIIIARGGSQRVLRKNIRPFAGKSLTEWTIIQAQACEKVSTIALSTDDDEIAEVGKKCGIEVIRRPVMDHDVSGAVVVSMAIDQLREMGYTIKHFVSLLPTGPLRLPWDLERGIDMYFEKALPKKTIVVPGNRASAGVCDTGPEDRERAVVYVADRKTVRWDDHVRTGQRSVFNTRSRDV